MSATRRIFIVVVLGVCLVKTVQVHRDVNCKECDGAKQDDTPRRPSIKLVRTIRTGDDIIQSLSFSPRARSLAVTTGKEVRIYDYETGEQTDQWKLGDRYCGAIAFTDGGGTLAANVESGPTYKVNIVFRDLKGGRDTGTIDLGGESMFNWAVPLDRGPVLTVTVNGGGNPLGPWWVGASMASSRTTRGQGRAAEFRRPIAQPQDGGYCNREWCGPLPQCQGWKRSGTV